MEVPTKYYLIIEKENHIPNFLNYSDAVWELEPNLDFQKFFDIHSSDDNSRIIKPKHNVKDYTEKVFLTYSIGDENSHKIELYFVDIPEQIELQEEQEFTLDFSETNWKIDWTIPKEFIVQEQSKVLNIRAEKQGFFDIKYHIQPNNDIGKIRFRVLRKNVSKLDVDEPNTTDKMPVVPLVNYPCELVFYQKNGNELLKSISVPKAKSLIIGKVSSKGAVDIDLTKYLSSVGKDKCSRQQLKVYYNWEKDNLIMVNIGKHRVFGDNGKEIFPEEVCYLASREEITIGGEIVMLVREV